MMLGFFEIYTFGILVLRFLVYVDIRRIENDNRKNDSTQGSCGAEITMAVKLKE